MAGLKVEGLTGTVVEVDAGNALVVNLGKTLSRTGYATAMQEVDAGTVTGTPRLRSAEVSTDWRLRAGVDTQLIDECFNYAAQNSGAFSHVLTTMTATYATGFLSLNASAITTINTGAMVRSYRTTQIYGSSPTYVEWMCLLTQPPQTNSVVEIGVGIPATAIAALTDGACFRYDATGALKGVLSYNGSETFTAAITPPADNTTNKYGLSISRNAVEFWINDILVAELLMPTAAASVFASASLPVFARSYNAGTAPALAQILRVSAVNAMLGDLATTKTSAHLCASAGLNGAQGAGGMTQGSTANMVNSTVPASATLANTTAGYATLGGQFQFAAVAGAETDYALFAYLVPAQTVNITGRQLHVTGVAIDVFNTVAAVATTATVMQWSLGFGCTAVTLAQAEGAATKAPRRIPLGVQSFPIGAAVGASASQLVANLQTPAVANPGEYIHVILKMPIATATATEVFRGIVRVEAYWE